ncbi:hypothetical protein MKW98_029428, partial [Papaver atlanticum]
TSDIETFVLYWDNKSNEIAKHLNSWILAALSHNVQVLHIEIRCNSTLTFKLPHQLFISQSLTDLTLDFDGGMLASNIFLPDSMRLPRLKSLALYSFTGGEGLMWLLSSCPVLSILIIRDMWVRDDDEGINVDCHEIKHLEIINTNTCVSFMAKIIKLSTPNLTSFICEDYMLQDYSLENLSSLVTANIHMMKEGAFDDHNEDERLPERMIIFLIGLHNVKELTLSPADFLQVVSEVPNLMECQSPHFHNLRSLTLEMCFTKRCLRTLTWLLKTSPYIEALFLTSEEFDEAEDGEVDSLVPLPFTLSGLKVIEIREFKGCDIEIEFLELVLTHAVVLEKMDLFFSAGENLLTLSDREKKIRRKLEAIPRVSSSFTMKFSK